MTKKIKFAKDESNELKLSILHTNDTHSYLDDFARRATLIEKIRKENEQKGIETLLFDCGDVFAGSIYFTMYEGQKEAELMNLLNYDAMTLGNHEFDRGSPLLANFFETIDFPVVATNIDMSQDSVLCSHVDQTVFSLLIKSLGNGERLAIFGLTTMTTTDSASPSLQTKFNDPVETAVRTVNKLKALGIKTIITLSHLGDDEDQKLAKAVAGIDLIIGGHTHRVIEKPIIINREGSLTAITQAGEYGKYVGQLDVTLSTAGTIKDIKGKLHPINQTITEAPKFKVMIDQIKREKVNVSSKIVGKTAWVLNGEREQLRLGETNLGNLVADAFFYKAKVKDLQPDLAIINSGGIRASILKGLISFGDLINVLPFSKTLMLLEVTGQNIKDALEYGLFPQVSRLQAKFDLNQATGKKLQELLILRNGQFEPIREQEKYRVVTNSFVGVGKDNFQGFQVAKVIVDNIALDVNALADYIADLPQPIKYETDQRLVYQYND